MRQQKNEADERLLVEAARKDPSRFAELYELHFERVYAYVARRMGNRQEAEDITSEVFQNALANIGKFEWRGVPFTAWLLRIASNAIADKWRLTSRERGNPSQEDSEEADFVDADEHARLFRLVRTLPGEQRRVVEMRFAEEKSIREIAQALGRSEGAVKQLQFRGLETLRAQFIKKPAKKSGAVKSGKSNG
ncbi:MAG TPA: sigma-70 family RNA polymerase sigma factor [Candidatus Acidoferrales bacterium]|nr:sigma-70 family RNA polymerase sigma factor [Candidatus Acidoferrales bacterium]